MFIGSTIPSELGALTNVQTLYLYSLSLVGRCFIELVELHDCLLFNMVLNVYSRHYSNVYVSDVCTDYFWVHELELQCIELCKFLLHRHDSVWSIVGR